MHPTPKRGRDEKWFVDFRGSAAAAFGVRSGRYVLPDLAPSASEVDAVHAAYRLIERLRRASPQLPLPDTDRPGPTFGQAVDTLTLARRRERMSAENERYVFPYLEAVKKELGHLPLAAFEGTTGDDTLIDYRNRLVDGGLKPRTRANRLNTVMQVLTRAQRDKLLAMLPEKPSPCVGNETLSSPKFIWYTEQDFRAVRERLFSVDPFGCLKRWHPDPAERADYIERRRLYLSFAFYTGLHTWDLDALTDAQVSPEIGAYERNNHKSAKCIAPIWLDMPEQLALDCQAELARLGRPWRSGELICGGPWKGATRLLTATAEGLGLPPLNFRITRRSCAHEYLLRGWSERDVAEVLGHADTTMVSEVYARIPARLRSPSKIPWNIASSRKALGGPTSTGKLFTFPGRAVPGTGDNR